LRHKGVRHGKVRSTQLSKKPQGFAQINERSFLGAARKDPASLEQRRGDFKMVYFVRERI
jgi:hypothetical protein